ncbi:response regulator transcription factor [Mesorhizobium erdmanii]|uniref:DNA-binding response regulator n=1 Tax=Mesorhizobium erdmanii TaxID=1777866 RepID=A0A6M7UI40_9HYPH|nr:MULTISPECIES: response regulator transcription factor [Mesorhizobium]OBQ74702.1 DNA-binding response regulator [Mesorhizobium loti]QKC76864.1 DNA-binding response regulator [Mesorhizobium erdmanii]
MNEPDQIVFVIDDDPAMREALDSLLRSVGLAVRCFGSVAEFLGAPRPDIPSCLVLDVRLPGKSGMDFHKELAHSETSLPVIVMTGHGDIAMSVQAMKAGAVDFLPKPFREQDLLDAITAALDKDRQQRARSAELDTLRERQATLSEGERGVVALVVQGRLNKQIAGELGVSEITVKVRRARAMRKMQAGSLAELIKMFGRLES